MDSFAVIHTANYLEPTVDTIRCDRVRDFNEIAGQAVQYWEIHFPIIINKEVEVEVEAKAKEVGVEVEVD